MDICGGFCFWWGYLLLLFFLCVNFRDNKILSIFWLCVCLFLVDFLVNFLNDRKLLIFDNGSIFFIRFVFNDIHCGIVVVVVVVVSVGFGCDVGEFVLVDYSSEMSSESCCKLLDSSPILLGVSVRIMVAAEESIT